MDPIQPINPALSNPIFPVQATRTNPTQEAQASSVGQSAIAQELQVDPTKLSKNQEYFLSTLDNILYKARGFYSQQKYEAAEPFYKELFTTFSRYVLAFPSMGQWGRFYGAFYEGAVVNYQLNQKKEAEAFLNRLFQLTMEREQFIQTPQGQQRVQALPPPLQALIETYQQQGKLPNLANQALPVQPETLLQLAQVAAQAQRNDLAANLAALALIRQGLQLFETQRAAQLLLPFNERPQTVVAPPVDYLLLPFGYRHTGLPYAYQPLPQTLAPPFKSTEPGESDLMPEVMGMVGRLDQNPDGDQERRRRRRMVNEYRRKKSKNNRRNNPQITF